MTRRSLADIPDSIAQTLEVLGEWWTPLVLRDVFYGLRRFDEIAADLPIARNVLADRLRSLVANGVLAREVYSTTPERFEYHLTDKGRDAFGILLVMMAWGDRWENARPTPPVTLLCRGCHTETTPVVSCSSCGERLSPDRVGVRPNHGQAVPRARLVLERPRPE